MNDRAARTLCQTAALSLGLLTSCVRATPEHPQAQRAAPDQRASSATVKPQAQRSRDLLQSGSFGDLVRRAEALEGQDAEATTQTGSCLLEATDQGFSLHAPIHQALRPLPQPAIDLDEALAHAKSAQVLTPWGRYGTEDGALVLSSFTGFTPARRALALIMTDRGVSLRGVGKDAVAAADGFAAESVAALGALEDTIVFVAAEAQVPVQDLYHLLDELARLRASVALATVLPARTRAPIEPAAHAPGEACPDGLSATDEAEGDLSREALLSGLAPLRERASDCLLRGDAKGAAGGQLVIAFRIDAAGRVEKTCLLRDDIPEPAVGACVLELARGLRFSPPSPAGAVDVELPLALRPHSAPEPMPVCAPTEPT